MVELSPEYLTAGKAGSGVGSGTPWETGQAIWSNLLINMLITGLFKKGINAGQIVNKLASATGGKGGGRPQYAQGAGKDRTNLRTVLEEVEKEIKQLV